MNRVVTVTYWSDEPFGEENGVDNSISMLLNAALPYMVDNLAIHFDVEEG